MQTPRTNFSRGTTLIEMILYVAIVAILLSGIGAVSMSVIDARSKTGAMGDVDRKSTRLNSSHIQKSRMPSSA